MDNEPADIEFRRKVDEITERWSKLAAAIARSQEEAFRRLLEAIKPAAKDIVKAFYECFMQEETRSLTWRERLRPRWRIFQWLHDAWYGEATFVCGERLNLHRGAGVEDWAAGLFEREME